MAPREPKMIIWRSALRGAAVGALVGLACGVLYSFGGLIVDLLTIGLNWGTLMAFGALLGMPLVFGGVGFAAGAVVGLVARVLQSKRTRAR